MIPTATRYALLRHSVLRACSRASASYRKHTGARMKIHFPEIVASDAVTRHRAFVAHPAMEIPGKGTFAIYIQGDADHGLWQL